MKTSLMKYFLLPFEYLNIKNFSSLEDIIDVTKLFVNDEIVWAFLEGDEIKRRVIGVDVALVLTESSIFIYNNILPD